MFGRKGFHSFTSKFLAVVLSLTVIACKKGGSAPSSDSSSSPPATPTPAPGAVDYSPTIAINSGAAYATSSSVTLTFTTNTPPDQMYVTQSSDCASGGTWEAYNTSKAWILANLEANNTIYFKVKGSTNESTCVNASIIHDDIAPSSPTLSINSGALYTQNTAVTLALSVVGGTQMYITQTAGCTSGGAWETYTTSKAWTLANSNASNTIYVAYRDAAGNVSTCANASITHDNLAPTGNSILINSGNAATGSLNVSLDLASTGASEMYVTNTAGCSSGGAWESYATSKTWTLAAPDTTDTVYVAFRDAAGNVSSCVSDSILHDSTLPVLTITSPNSGSYANSTTQNSFAVSGACGANGQAVTISGAVTASVTCSSSAWTANLDVSSLADGNFTINVNHSNSAGNAAPQVSRTFAKDIVAPTGNSLSINSGAAYTNSTTVTLTPASTDAADMYITNTSGCGSGGSWESFASSKTWTLGQTNATATVYAKYRDAAGNATSCVSATIIHDSVAPTLTMTNPATNSYVNSTNVASVAVSGTCNEAGRTVTLSGAATGSATCSSGTWSTTVNFSSASEGNLTLTASLSDAAGNTTTINRNIVKDTIAPTGSLVLNGGDDYTSSPDLTLTLSTNDGTQMYITEDSTCASGGSYVSFASSAAFSSTQSEGINYIFVKFRDAAQNESTCYQASIIFDDIDPSWTDVPLHANANNSTNSSPMVFYQESAIDSDSGVQTYQYAVGTNITTNQNDIKDWTTVSGGSFMATGLSLTAGQRYYISMRAYDAAGNFTTISSGGWIVDVVPPNLTLTAPANNALVTEYDIKMVGSCESPYTVNLSYGSDMSGDASSACTGNTFIAYASFSGTSGSRSVTLQQTDGGGNTTSVNLNLTYRRPIDFAGTVLASVKQSDGSMIYGGAFQSVTTNREIRLVRLNSDGTKDNSFNVSSGFNGQILAMIELADGSIVVGGDFTSYRARPAYRIAKIDSSGNLDTSFNPATGSNGFNNAVRALVLNGSTIYAGGDFTTYRGTAAKYVAKIDVSGALDTTFNPTTGNNGSDNRVRALAWDGSALYIGGDFTHYRTVAANRLAKLDSSGNMDTGFSGTGTNGLVRAIVTDNAGSIWFGGDFTTFQGSPANRIGKVSSGGVLDTTFSPSSGSNGITSGSTYVYGLALNGSNLFAAGTFTKYRGTNANRIAKISATTGVLDTTYNPTSGNNGANNVVNSVVSSGSTVYFGGTFTTYKAAQAVRIGKTNLSGAMDTTFDNASGPAGFGNAVNAVLISSSGQLYVGGVFSSYRGNYITQNIAKINSDDSVDTTFSPQSGANGMNNTVRALAYDGTYLYAGGDFTTCWGTNCDRIASFDSNHVLNPNFGFATTTFGPNNVVRALVLYGPGCIAIGGDFTTWGTGVPVGRYVKLNTSNGDFASDFSVGPGTGANNSVRAIAVAADGSNVFLGGLFTTFAGAPANRIAKLAPYDILDTTFNPSSGANGTNSYVYSLAIDGTYVYLGGAFTNYRGGIANRIAKVSYNGVLDTTLSNPSGSNGFNSSVNTLSVDSTNIYAGGAFTTYRGKPAVNITKLSKAGVMDTTFSPASGGNGTTGTGSQVYTTYLDGTDLYIGGSFSYYRGLQAIGVVKVNTSTGAQQP